MDIRQAATKKYSSKGYDFLAVNDSELVRVDTESLIKTSQAYKDIVGGAQSSGNLKSLKSYCTGDGTTDDTQGLINAIAENNALYIPSGRYLITGTIEIDKPFMFIGENNNTSVIVCAGDNTLIKNTYFICESPSIHFENIRFVGGTAE